MLTYFSKCDIAGFYCRNEARSILVIGELVDKRNGYGIDDENEGPEAVGSDAAKTTLQTGENQNVDHLTRDIQRPRHCTQLNVKDYV